MMRLRGWLWLSLLAVPMAAEVRLPHVLSDHAVLQRNAPVRVWGWAAPKEHVSVSFHDQSVDTVASEYGAWEIFLKPESAGGPYVLKVTGDATSAPLERTDILVGDVWLASGQSNMEMPLKGFNGAPIKDSEKEIAAANYPKIRLLLQKKRTAAVPVSDSEDSWTLCTPETAKDFSAAAYFFGRKIQQEENVPIGLIDTTWGGTPAHAWISQEGLAWSNLPSVSYDAGAIARQQQIADALKINGAAQNAALKAAGKPELPPTKYPGDHGGSYTPATLFNGMVAPYTKYTLRGFLWYQGETDHEGIRALNYSRVFPALIQDWRKQWGQGPLPFLWVQIASLDAPGDGWAQVRDAQRRTLELVNTGMAVTLDIGLPKNIHPPDKQTVGARLAQSALGISYGKNVETASPMFTGTSTEGNAIRAWFTHAAGLKTSDAVLGDFEVAGQDGKFVPAVAKIEVIAGQPTVIASSDKVASPKLVRYGWAPYVKSYVYNSAGLPLGTFTSDSDAVMLTR